MEATICRGFPTSNNWRMQFKKKQVIRSGSRTNFIISNITKTSEHLQTRFRIKCGVDTITEDELYVGYWYKILILGCWYWLVLVYHWWKTRILYTNTRTIPQHSSNQKRKEKQIQYDINDTWLAEIWNTKTFRKFKFPSVRLNTPLLSQQYTHALCFIP